MGLGYVAVFKGWTMVEASVTTLGEATCSEGDSIGATTAIFGAGKGLVTVAGWEVVSSDELGMVGLVTLDGLTALGGVAKGAFKASSSLLDFLTGLGGGEMRLPLELTTASNTIPMADEGLPNAILGGGVGFVALLSDDFSLELLGSVVGIKGCPSLVTLGGRAGATDLSNGLGKE
jgi:hypothetical protein